jgi:hypothetical protein
VSNRAGHNDRNLILFSAAGKVLLEPFPFGLTPLEWDGDPARELLGGQIGNFNGKEIVFTGVEQPNLPRNSYVLMVADLYGDFRDELVLSVTGEDRKKFVAVVTGTHPMNRRYVAATENLDYCLWLARNMGGGYRSIYDHSLKEPRPD